MTADIIDDDFEDDLIQERLLNELHADERKAELAHIERRKTWSNQFVKRDLMAKALLQLNKGFPPDEVTDRVTMKYPLRCQVLDSCYRASIFKRNADAYKMRIPDGKKSREAIKFLIAEVDHLRRQLKNVSSSASLARRDFSASAFRRAISALEKNSDTITIKCTDLTDHAVILDNILEAYSAQLDLITTGSAADQSRGTITHWGCFSYSNRRNARFRRPEVETMLFFDLLQTFTIQSKGGNSFAKERQKMPKEIQGYDLAAAFVKATFFDEVTICRTKSTRDLRITLKNRLKPLLRRTPPMTCGRWPRSNEEDIQ